VLSLDDWEQLQREICASGPVSGDNSAGQNMDVQRHPGVQWLITGRAKGRREDADAIGAELARIWENRLR
jgi:hypothetical protein